MNPNHSNNYQPYNGQYTNPQFNSYQFSNQSHFTQNSLNVPHLNNFNQGGSLTPTQNNQLTKNKVDRIMYSSTIQPASTNKNFSFGKLQSMGRFVGENDQTRNDKKKLNAQNTQNFNQHKQFAFNQNREQKPKMFEPTIRSNNIGQFDRFPQFNLQQNSNQQQYNGLNNQMQQKNYQLSQNSSSVQTPEQRRRRQILAIKQQLEMINKKMQSSNLNRKYSNQIEKNDNKFHTNQGSNINQSINNANINSNNSDASNLNLNVNNYPNSNNFLNTNNSLNSNNTFSGPKVIQPNSYGNTLLFNKSNQLGAPTYERNKGLATQSMIVTNQPSPGYRYQSIFDKSDTLKKPTYQISEKKQDQPLLLDKFINKGSSINTGNSFNASNNYNVGSSSTSNNPTTVNQSNLKSGSYNNLNTANLGANYDFTSQFGNRSNQVNTNYKSDYTSSTTSSTSVQSQSSNSTFKPIKQTGMFKKKKQNPYIEQPKIQMIPTPLKENTIQQTVTFKKPPTPLKENPIQQTVMFKKFHAQKEQNFITNTLKQLHIQESTIFKRQDFVVGKKLGKGQFGQVMLVQHKKTGFLCGMKVMQKKQIRDEKYEGQIARQLSIQFYLAHRNIAPLYGYFEDEKNVYLLVEYCTGGQLLQMLRKNRRMEEPEVSRVIRQIIEGIDYIHKELIIHRDIKPENILFNFGVAKICDYGWAVYKGHGMRKTASVGSPLYYSPEIVMGVQYDQKIDIWDIGMMTYECLLGKIPFRIYSELDLNRIVEDEISFPEYIDTTQEAKDFILKIMKKKPEQRMEIRQMLRHPFITKYQDLKLPLQIMKDLKQVLN